MPDALVITLWVAFLVLYIAIWFKIVWWVICTFPWIIAFIVAVILLLFLTSIADGKRND